MDYLTLVYALIAAIVYAASFYIKNRQTSGEPFDPAKFTATLIVGLIIGIVALLTGSTLTEMDMVTQLIAYAGLVTLIETWLKTLIRGAGWKEQPAATPKKARK